MLAAALAAARDDTALYLSAQRHLAAAAAAEAAATVPGMREPATQEEVRVMGRAGGWLSPRGASRGRQPRKRPQRRCAVPRAARCDGAAVRGRDLAGSWLRRAGCGRTYVCVRRGAEDRCCGMCTPGHLGHRAGLLAEPGSVLTEHPPPPGNTGEPAACRWRNNGMECVACARCTSGRRHFTSYLIHTIPWMATPPGPCGLVGNLPFCLF